MKLKKKDQELIDFFKLVGVYDEDIFKYIYNHKFDIKIKVKSYIYNHKFDIKNKSEVIYLDLDYLKDNRLMGFTINAPVIKNNIDMLKSIYLFSKAINLYKKIGKIYKEELTDEILPLSLVKIYAELNLSDNVKKKILSYEYDKLNDNISYLLAYDLQFDIADNYLKTNILLTPESFYVDDVNSLKERCLSKKYF